MRRCARVRRQPASRFTAGLSYFAADHLPNAAYGEWRLTLLRSRPSMQFGTALIPASMFALGFDSLLH